jgi:hypothetical protein
VASTTPDKPPATAEKPPKRRDAGPGIVIARPFGIPVYISPYWFLIAGVFILIYANDQVHRGGGLRRAALRVRPGP